MTKMDKKDLNKVTKNLQSLVNKRRTDLVVIKRGTVKKYSKSSNGESSEGYSFYDN